MFNKSSLQKVIKTKVSPENPCGENIRQATSFFELKSEMRKMEHVTGHAKINWSKVSKQALVILETESKDILVAVYLVIAWSKVHSSEGLVQGLDFLTELINKFSSDLQPQSRPKGYSVALGWLAKQLQKNFQADFFASLDKKYLAQLKASLLRLNQATQEHFKDDSLAGLVPEIERKMASFERKAQPVVEAEEPIIADPVEETTASGELTLPTDALDVTKEKAPTIKEGMPDVESLLLQKSNQLLKDDYQDVRAYVLSRTAIWGDLVQLPEYDENFETHISFPNKMTELDIQHLKGQKYSATKIRALEAYAQRYPFWLDLHRVLYQCLANESGHQAILSVLKYFLLMLQERFAQVTQLKFSDGTRCSSLETKKWLLSLGNLHTAEKCTIPSITQTEGDEDKLAALLNKVGSNSNSNEQEQKELLQYLQQTISTTKSVRERVVSQMTLCECLLMFNTFDLLPVYLTELQNYIEQYQIIAWEPDLAAQLFSLLYKANNQLAESANNEQKQYALAKLMILDNKLYQKLTKFS